MHLFHSHFSRWSTINFNLTIQTLPDDIWHVFETRIRLRIESLKKLIDENSPKDSESEDEDHSAPSSEKVLDYMKELEWLNQFSINIDRTRRSRGVRAAFKWKIKKADKLTNELSKVNYLKNGWRWREKKSIEKTADG
jgi:hypothetical protein